MKRASYNLRRLLIDQCFISLNTEVSMRNDLYFSALLLTLSLFLHVCFGLASAKKTQQSSFLRNAWACPNIFLENCVAKNEHIQFFIIELKIESQCLRTSSLLSCVVLMYMYVITSLWRCSIGRPILHQSCCPFTLMLLANHWNQVQ